MAVPELPPISADLPMPLAKGPAADVPSPGTSTPAPAAPKPQNNWCAVIEFQPLRAGSNALDGIFLRCYILAVEWEVEFTDEFERWWDGLKQEEQEDVAASVILLQRFGPTLPYPHCSGIAASRHQHMRELRIQHAGRPYRVLYAFNPLRAAILLVGGDKTGNDRWYETFVPVADDLYDGHIEELRKAGKL